MKDSIEIAFLDQDRFFADGSCRALDEYFRQRGVRMHCTESMGADLIFQAVPPGVRARFCHTLNSSCGVYLAIRDNKDPFGRHAPACQREGGEIYRNESVDMLLQTVDRVMRVRSRFVGLVSCCSRCESVELTRQEKMIMCYLSWEMTPTAIARRLNVSIKTVSTHKRAVMKKMNFHRNAELYHWLRVEET